MSHAAAERIRLVGLRRAAERILQRRDRRPRHAPRAGHGAPGRGVRRRRAHGGDRRHAHGADVRWSTTRRSSRWPRHAACSRSAASSSASYVDPDAAERRDQSVGAGHTQLAYHRDLPYQHFVSSRPLAISALFCIDPFTHRDRRHHGDSRRRIGWSCFRPMPWPRSSTRRSAPSRDRSSSSTRWSSTAPARTARAGRAARVNQVFSTPIIAQQISLPDALDGRYAGDPALARLLGYEVAPAARSPRGASAGSPHDPPSARLRRTSAPDA